MRPHLRNISRWVCRVRELFGAWDGACLAAQESRACQNPAPFLAYRRLPVASA
jgi:hypothetical protein